MHDSQTQTKHMDISNTPKSAETKDKENYPLIEREQIENTPFWIVGNDEIGYKLTWGKFTFNDEPLKTKEECAEWFKVNQWTIILHMIAIGIAQSKNQLIELQEALNKGKSIE